MAVQDDGQGSCLPTAGPGEVRFEQDEASSSSGCMPHSTTASRGADAAINACEAEASVGKGTHLVQELAEQVGTDTWDEWDFSKQEWEQ